MPMLWIIILVILIVALVGGLPHWGYWGPEPRFGYAPSGLLTIIVVVLLILLLLGRL